MMLPLRMELAMTFKAIFPNGWRPAGGTGVLRRKEAVSGRNILIWPADATLFRPFLAPWGLSSTLEQSAFGGLRLGKFARPGVVLGKHGGHGEFAGLDVVDAAPSLDPRARLVVALDV